MSFVASATRPCGEQKHPLSPHRGASRRADGGFRETHFLPNLAHNRMQNNTKRSHGIILKFCTMSFVASATRPCGEQKHPLSPHRGASRRADGGFRETHFRPKLARHRMQNNKKRAHGIILKFCTMSFVANATRPCGEQKHPLSPHRGPSRRADGGFRETHFPPILAHNRKQNNTKRSHGIILKFCSMSFVADRKSTRLNSSH